MSAANHDLPTAFALAPVWWRAMATLNTTAVGLAAQSQLVILQRMMMVAQRPESSRTHREQQKMVTEKVSAAIESGAAITTLWWEMALALPTLFTDPRAGVTMINDASDGVHKVLQPYVSRVNENARRLSR